MKIETRDAGEIISRTAVLNAISAARKPYIVNNSRNTQWVTPQQYIESARKVMGSIDLDPAIVRPGKSYRQSVPFLF